MVDVLVAATPVMTTTMLNGCPFVAVMMRMMMMVVIVNL